MPRVLKLRNSIQAYAWGSRTAIAELLGTPVPAEPQAELWMGAHPKAASEVWVDGAWRALDRMIEECGASILGSRVCAAFGGRLPFLFKILAAAEPLSIQAHPNKARAAAGFERENAAGLGLADPLRNYRDAHHKPEILYALTPFTALRGFLPAAEIDERLRASGLGAHLPGAREAGLSGFFSAFLNLEGGAVALAIEQALARSGRLGAESARWIERLAASYPGDRGALAPVFMRRVDLNPGEAVFTPPGVLHAYLEGVGVELMASSDNVLRGGLTRKHVEPDELMRIARFEVEGEDEDGRIEPRGDDGLQVFETPAEEFLLAVIRPRAGRQVALPGAGGPGLYLCTGGAGVLSLAGGGEHPFARGDSFLVTAAGEGSSTPSAGAVSVAGEATLFGAQVPDPAAVAF